MATHTQSRLSVRSKLDSNRPSSRIGYELEGLGLCYYAFSSSTANRGCRGARHVGGGREMNTLKLLIGSAVMALAANAILPSLPDNATLQPECEQVQPCEPTEKVEIK